jgi:hypothetical protein
VKGTMGQYLGVYKLFGKDAGRIDGDRIGGAGSARCLIDQWIAGYCISPSAKSKDFELARSWLRYGGQRYAALQFRQLKTVTNVEMALRDDADDCTWVSVDYTQVDRGNLCTIDNQGLLALLALWNLTRQYDSFDPYILITDDMAKAVLTGTEMLEEQCAAWAKKCRTFCTMIQRGHEKGAHVSIG